MKILLLAGNTSRARAYAQRLANIKIDGLEIQALLLGHDLRGCNPSTINDATKNYFQAESMEIPDLSISVKDTCLKNNWMFHEIDQTDANSIEVLDQIQLVNPDMVIFAGYGGQILSKDHFLGDLKYLHMHPGDLPEERGSTTIYYSILNKRKICVTAFYMSERIDSGRDIIKKYYPRPSRTVDIDGWLDNIIRADCMHAAVLRVWENANLGYLESSARPSEYYVIHPVLKHLAILSLND